MLTITYNGYELDLTDAADLFWSLASTDLSNLSVREGGFNNTWQLNTSQQNREAFGFIDQPDSNLDAAYVFRPVNIYNDGCLVFTGLGRVTDVRLNKISLLVVDGVGGLSERLDALSLERLDLGVMYSPEAIKDSIDNYDTEFPLIAFGFASNGIGDKFATAVTGIPMLCFQPWINLRKLTHLIIQTAGYSVADTDANPLELTTYIGGNGRASDADFMRFGTNTGTIDAPQPFVIGFGNGGGSASLEFTNPTFNTVDVTSYTLPIAAQGVLNVALNVTIYYKMTTGATAKVFLRYQSSSRTYNLWEIDLPSTGIDGETRNLQYEFTTRLDEYNDATSLNEQRISLQFTYANSVNSSNEFVFNSANIAFTAIDEIAEYSPVTGRCVGPMTAKEVVVEYCNRFGKLLTIDEVNWKVTFGGIARLANTTNAVDWREKQYEPTELFGTGPYESTFVYGDLALRNFWRNEGGVGTGVLVTQTTTGDAERDAYSSPATVAPSINDVTVIANLNIDGMEYYQFVPVYEDATQPNEGLTFCYTGVTVPFGFTVYFRHGYSRVKLGTPTPTDASVPPYPFTYGSDKWDYIVDRFRANNPKAYIAKLVTRTLPRVSTVRGFPDGATPSTYVDDAVEITSVVTPSFEPLHWQPLLNTYYLPLFTALNRPRVDKYLVKLNDSDIANIDFSRPVLINGSYYYIVLIDQYDIINQSPTPVVLLRLL